MKKIFISLLVFVLCMLSTISFANDINFKDPKSLVNGFIYDYYNWNKNSLRSLEGENYFSPEKEYSNLLMKYCFPEKVGRNGSIYGQYPLHYPEGEKIMSSRIKRNTAIVVTKVPSRFSETDDDVDIFEYQLFYKNNRWFINEVFSIDKTGKKTRTL
ncbi:hypothetical protein [Photorhabdus cinerea]|uniref:DUF3828 domain-containing protein n=1 Tax=Photorhabdus cinerea TaxID=471575 RepID=A0A7X5QI37_9GAMM|nr:hypothetical protein [Photorhabdus cinerea]NHB94784.1 hypothetical protein [Photorhabdus cinerea]